MNTLTHDVEWIYFFEEPKRHKGIIELGRTGRTVEDRNRDKRSIDPWKEIARYPVISCEKVESEIIKATKNYRYNRRKEILEIDWLTLKNIVEPICEKWTHKEYFKRLKLQGTLNEYDKKESLIQQKILNANEEEWKKRKQLLNIEYKQLSLRDLPRQCLGLFFIVGTTLLFLFLFSKFMQHFPFLSIILGLPIVVLYMFMSMKIGEMFEYDSETVKKIKDQIIKEESHYEKQYNDLVQHFQNLRKEYEEKVWKRLNN